MLREKHKWKPRKCESTEAERRDGATRSSEEVPVMGMERRGSIIQLELEKTTEGWEDRIESSKVILYIQTAGLGGV